jgi:hypothetical protein
MKKNYLFYLFMTACAGFLFTSCGKDDPDPEVEPVEVVTWKDAAGSYKADGTLKLTIDGVGVTDPKEVALAVGTSESAKITLKNIIPDEATVEFSDLTMTKEGDNSYTFAAETTINLVTVSITGSLSGITDDIKTLDLSVTRKINSPLCGVWQLKQDGPVYVLVETGNELVDGMLNGMGLALSGMLKEKVNSVEVVLGNDGLFDLVWQEVGSNVLSSIPAFVKQMKVIQFFVLDDKLYLAIDKSALPLLAAIPLPEGLDIDLSTTITALGEDRGGFIVFPIDARVILSADSPNASSLSVTLSIGKETILRLMQIVMPLLTGALPVEGEILQLIQGLPDIVTGATTFEVGITFESNVLP